LFVWLFVPGDFLLLLRVIPHNEHGEAPGDGGVSSTDCYARRRRCGPHTLDNLDRKLGSDTVRAHNESVSPRWS